MAVVFSGSIFPAFSNRPWSYFMHRSRRTASSSRSSESSPRSTALLIPKKHCERDSSSALRRMVSTPALIAMAQAWGSGHFFRMAAMPMASETTTPWNPISSRSRSVRIFGGQGGGELLVEGREDRVRRHQGLGAGVDARLEGDQLDLVHPLQVRPADVQHVVRVGRRIAAAGEVLDGGDDARVLIAAHRRFDELRADLADRRRRSARRFRGSAD